MGLQNLSLLLASSQRQSYSCNVTTKRKAPIVSTFGVFFISLVVLLSIMATAAFGQTNYQFEIIAQTGVAIAGSDSIPGTNPIVDLGPGPSINNLGKVAFVARDESGIHGRIMVVNQEGIVKRNLQIPPTERIGTDVQINDKDQVVWWKEIVAPGSTLNGDTAVVRSDLPLDVEDPIIGMGSSWFTSTPFSYVLPWATINNNGLGVITGDLKTGGSVLASRNGGSGPHEMAQALSGSPNFFPMVSDNNRVVIRGGNDVTDPLIVFTEPTLDSTLALFIATSDDFNVIGSKPGISDDGRVVVFMADDISQGPGIYMAAINSEANQAISFKVANISIGSNLAMRVGVNQSNGEPFDYTIVYLNEDTTGLGLYSVRVNVSNPNAPVIVSPPIRLIGAGATIVGLESLGTVQNIGLYDPINNNSQLVFWVRATNAQAIIRSSPDLMIESYDANPMYAGKEIVKIVSGQDPNYDALAKFEPLNMENEPEKQVKAIAADGVSILLLKFTNHHDIQGEVTFSIESTSSGPTGSLWDVQSGPNSSLFSTGDGDWEDEARTGDIQLTVPMFSSNSKNYAFVLYRAPRNFDKDPIDNDEPGSIRKIQVMARFNPLDQAQHSAGEVEINIFIVRPPVLLVHGTWADHNTWNNFPLWQNSANKDNGFTFTDYPFQVFKLNFGKNSDGRLETNARIILAQIEDAIQRFRTTDAFWALGIDRVAAAQADIVTHSYGGPITRKASQIQNNDKHTTTIEGQNFRNYNNLGYGYIHKLITLSGTHKGSQMSAHTAKVNAETGGILKRIGSNSYFPRRIDCGALADQNVVSEALQSLVKTTYPSHAVVGSGLFENSDTLFGLLQLEQLPFVAFWEYMFGNPEDFSQEALDKRNGPYCLGAGPSSGDSRYETFRRLGACPRIGGLKKSGY